MFNRQIDFLSIGDITTDAFIRLSNASVHCEVNKEQCQICMNFGDKIPYEFVEEVRAVGNSANAAVSASRLGLNSALVSNLGNDENGRACLKALKEAGVSTKFIKAHSGAKTNYHYVLWYEDDRTILVKHEKYNYQLPNLKPPKWLYVSSIGSNTEKYHDEIIDFIEKNPTVKVAFQPGTFQMALGATKLTKLYQNSDVFICNVEESEKILGLGKTEIKALLAGIRTLGPKIVLITDGPKGAYLSDDSGNYFMPIYPDEKPPYERTGAGDAFASTFVSALCHGQNQETALKWAMVNSMSVVQKIGAQAGLLSQAEINAWLTKAPANFKLVKI